MDSLSRTSLLPQTISFPLSAFAPDHRSPPASDWMLSCFQSSHLLSRPPPRSIRPPVSFVWLSPASTRFPFSLRLHPMSFVNPRSTLLAVDFWINSALVYYTTARVHPNHCPALVWFVFLLMRSHAPSAPRPSLTYPVRSGRAIVDSSYYHGPYTCQPPELLAI